MITATAILTETIVVSASLGGSVCQPATYTLVDEDANVLDTGSIISGGAATIIAPDGTVLRDGLPYGSVLSGGTIDVPSETCADATIDINGVQVGTVPSGGTTDIVVRNSGVTPVGALDGSGWEVADSPITRNGIAIDVVKAEATFPLVTKLDGASNNGVYTALTKTLDFTSNPSNLQINGVQSEVIAGNSTFNLLAKLDGVAGGVYNAGLDTLNFTTTPAILQRNAIQIKTLANASTFNLITKLDGAANNGTWDGVDTLDFTSAACSPAALQINGTPSESIASGATFNLIALLDGVAGGTYDAPSDTLSFTSNSGWIRPSAWITMPTLTAADERFYGIVAVFENRYNVIAVTLNSTSSNINWGDGTSVVSNGGQRVKVYDYASLVGTVNVWPTGENYKQVLVDITRVGVAITSMDWMTLGAVNYYGGNNFIDVNFSLPSLTTCNLSLDPPSGTKGMTMLQRLRIWSSGTIAGQFFRGLKSLRVVQFPATFQGSFSNAFLNGGEVDDCGNMNFGTSTAITNFWSGTGLKKHGSYTANSVVGNGTNYVQYCGQLAQFGTINATLQTTFDSFFYECYTLMAVGLITAPAATNLSSMFFRCTILGSVQFSNCATVTTTTSMFGNCVGLFDCVMPNLTRGVNFTGTAMANYGMNRFANSLGIASGAQTITATGTPFSALITAADATALAIRAVITGKGFTYTN